MDLFVLVGEWLLALIVKAVVGMLDRLRAEDHILRFANLSDLRTVVII